MNSRCSVLVSSCDKYKDTWNPFFHFFFKYWKSCPYQVYLNTESLSYENEEGIITLTCDKRESTWSYRLKSALRKIKSEYIIFLLDDFFLLDSVIENEIEKSIAILDNDKKVSVIDFELPGRHHVISCEYEDYAERCRDSMYFLNCQASIWRKKDLIMYLSPYESPWQFELYGSDRAKLYNKRFLVATNYDKLPFKYKLNPQDGYGLYRGKWLKSNIDLFARNNIQVEFDNLGFYNGYNADTKCSAPKKCFRDRCLYLLYGGGPEIRMSIYKQLKYSFSHPRIGIAIIKRKLKYMFTQYR